MYKLPQDEELSFLLNKTLLQVCIGLNDLILNFDDQIVITITSCLGIISCSGNLVIHESFINSASDVLSLIGREITLVSGDAKGTLTLLFDNGVSLCAYDDSQEYESYTIRNGNKLIVV